MMRYGVFFFLALALTGCQAQAPRPAPVADTPAADSGPSAEAVQKASQARFDTLDERFLLMQEQLIQANRQLETIAQRTQQQLVALQRVQMLQAAAAQASVGETEIEGPSTLDQLTELVFRLEQLSTEAADAAGPETAIPADALGFNMVSTVTHTGQWVIFKYDEITGLAWNVLDGGWVEVGEPEPLDNSHYQVVLRPSRTDVKHYVAARIDRRTGQTWWLKNNRWEVFP